eukprot:4641783-Pyramimonas_sp.AAC.1
MYTNASPNPRWNLLNPLGLSLDPLGTGTGASEAASWGLLVRSWGPLTPGSDLTTILSEDLL